MPFSDRFLFTVHGINSTNEGLASLRSSCEASLPGIMCDSFNYGTVLPYKELTTSVGQFVFRTIRGQLELINIKYLQPNNMRCYVVCHSFGTLALVRALEMGVPNLQIEGLILLGSIVPRDYYWDGLINKRCLKYPPLSIVRPFDKVVRSARLVGGGTSGAEGFIATGFHRPREVHKSGGHTSYYPDDTDDVIAAVRYGTGSVPTKDAETWLAEQPILKRIRFNLFKKFC